MTQEIELTMTVAKPESIMERMAREEREHGCGSIPRTA